MKKYNFIDLTGKKFGKLLVIKMSQERGNKGQIKWDCICDCGNSHIVTGESLRSGKSKSCGCLRHKEPPNKLKNRYEFLRKRLYQYLIIKRSKQIKKEYNLTYKEFCEIINLPCLYCGEIESNCIKDYAKGRLISDTVINYNGLDRINSNLGYLKDNVVPCCKMCNRAKSDMSIEEFKKWIYKVYNHYMNTETEPYCNVGKMRVEGIVK